MITHRLHLNNYFDEVIYIDRNGVIEQGSNQELIYKKNGKYQLFWEKYMQI